MARGVNKVILVGNVGADIELRYMPSGGAVCEVSVATSEQWTDKKTDQKHERTEWHRVSVFNRMAEVAAEFLSKGSQVYFEGSIRTDKYQDKEGKDQYSTKIIARDMQLLGSRSDGDSSNQRQPQQQAPQRSQQGAPPAAQGFDDDIPFTPLQSYP